jgi:AraC-like DNA-binding protein
MELSLNIYAIILGLTLFQAILFASILIIRAYRDNHQSDYLLALLVLLLGLTFVPDLFGWLGIHVLWNDFTFYPWDGFELAVLPTAMLFLQSRLNSSWKFTLKHLKYYWLYIVYFTYHLVVAIQGKEFAKWWWYEVNNKYNIDAVFVFCNLLLFIFYIYDFTKIYKSYQIWSANRYSDLRPLNISWIRNFLIVYCIFVAITVVLSLMALLIGVQYEKMWWAYLLNLGITYYISIYGYSYQPSNKLDFRIEDHGNFGGKISDNNVSGNTDTEVKNLEAVDEAGIQLWRDKITKYMTEEQPFLNPDLRLAELANHFKINISTLSTILNHCFDKNFNDLVNEYRINGFTNSVDAGHLSQFTLLSIAYDSGFNSKTTFNRAFKKQHGMSPSDYINSHKSREI